MAQYILNDQKDNVITALTKLEKGQVIHLGSKERIPSITLKDSIPFAHKFAITEIMKGDKIVKYGEAIGMATRNIQAGEHVHVHNLQSIRGTVGYE
jgi:altronate dehydratase small subunit